MTLKAPPHFRGEFIAPAAAGYEQARRIADRRFDARPAAVARCAGVADVRAAVSLAASAGLPIAVRAGGNGFHGHATIEGGIVVDLSAMRDVSIDPVARTARIRGGALGGDVIAETTRLGHAPASGTRARVGFVGQVAFNGQGYLSHRYGNACDNVLAAEMVLADGSVVDVDAESHPDLFWAVRGAGDSFGVITAVTVQLHPAPGLAHSGTVSWSAAEAVDGLVALAELDASLSDEISWSVQVTASLDRAPRIAVSYTHVGSAATLARDVELIDAETRPAHHSDAAIPYADLHYLPGFTGERTYLAGCQLRGLDRHAAELLVTVADELAEAPDESGFEFRSVHVRPFSKALSRPPVVPNACTLREGLACSARVSYHRAAEEPGHVEWARTVTNRFVDAGLSLRGFNGTSLNYVSDLDEQIVARYYGEAFGRLRQIKARHDPDGIFRRSVLGLVTGRV